MWLQVRRWCVGPKPTPDKKNLALMAAGAAALGDGARRRAAARRGGSVARARAAEKAAVAPEAVTSRAPLGAAAFAWWRRLL